MTDTKIKLLFLPIVCLYGLSWFLPIANDLIGHQGASFAIDTLKDGAAYFYNIKASKADSASEAFLQLIGGLCNVLFITASVFIFIKPAWGYVLTPITVISMLVWFGFGYGIGYYMWLLSGFLLFLYSSYAIQKALGVKVSSIITGIWSLPIYVPTVFTGVIYLTLFMERNNA